MHCRRAAARHVKWPLLMAISVLFLRYKGREMKYSSQPKSINIDQVCILILIIFISYLYCSVIKWVVFRRLWSLRRLFGQNQSYFGLLFVKKSYFSPRAQLSIFIASSCLQNHCSTDAKQTNKNGNLSETCLNCIIDLKIVQLLRKMKTSLMFALPL